VIDPGVNRRPVYRIRTAIYLHFT